MIMFIIRNDIIQLKLVLQWYPPIFILRMVNQSKNKKPNNALLNNKATIQEIKIEVKFSKQT